MDQILAEISAADPALAPLLTATHTVADLRLNAGLIVSRLASVIIKGEPYTLRDVATIYVQQGQVIELHRLLLASISLANIGEAMRDVVALMEQRYFAEAQRVIDGLIDRAVDTGHFTMTTAQILAEYEPGWQVLVAMRERLSDLTRQAMEAEQAARLHRLEATAAAGGA